MPRSHPRTKINSQNKRIYTQPCLHLDGRVGRGGLGGLHLHHRDVVLLLGLLGVLACAHLTSPTTRSSTRWRRVASWRPRRWLRRRRRGRGRPARRRGRSRSRPTRTACPVRQTPSRRAPRYRTLAGHVKSTVKQTARAV